MTLTTPATVLCLCACAISIPYFFLYHNLCIISIHRIHLNGHMYRLRVYRMRWTWIFSRRFFYASLRVPVSMQMKWRQIENCNSLSLSARRHPLQCLIRSYSGNSNSSGKYFWDFVVVLFGELCAPCRGMTGLRRRALISRVCEAFNVELNVLTHCFWI